MCTIRMPRYLDPNFFQHENPTLTAIFNTAVPQVAQVLAKFDSSHPVVEDCNAYFKSPEGDGKKRHIYTARDAHFGASTVRAGNPANIWGRLRSASALAVQHELQKPLNLNGDLFGDLKDERVISCPYDSDEGLEMMFWLVSGELRDMIKGML
ncbi:hypothetical protein B0H17DRAFT_1144358 [Mycena rosella]|uniref:Uncharacterized protein n=1 Tax=Mycena rosella TaxID=1033263 RepID=A0AAD7G5T0_MYCRO|nr:hypothetical protein B0H17DRAFT_1144358 [Mycena rosella]